MSVAVPLPSVDVPHGSASSGKENQQRMLASAPPMDPYYIPQLDAEQLKSVIEYFLSRTYLEGDPYLVSQMNTDLYLPVELLVERISTFVCPTEFADVILAIESSKEVSLDASKTLVRPNFKLARNTIILRDLTGITEKEVNDLFLNELPFKPTEITKEVGDCWFVAFDSEANALTALAHVRKQKYNGVPIHARLKQESLLRSSNTIDAVSMAYYPDMYYGMMDYDLQGQYENDPSSEAQRPGQDGKESQRRNHRFGRGGRYNRKGRDFNPNSNSNSQPNSNNNTNASSNGSNADGSGRHGGYGHRNKGRHANTGRKRVNSGKRGAQASINLGLAHFPPLHAQDQKSAKPPQSLKKWSKQEIVDIIKTLGENPPRSSELPADCIAILSSPNGTIDVLKPLPRVETIDLSKVAKGPDYKAVVAKPGNADAQKGAKAAKHVPKPANATVVSAEKSNEKSQDKSHDKAHEKPHEKKKGQKGKKPPSAGHGKPKEAEKSQPNPPPAVAAPHPTEAAGAPSDAASTEHANELRSEADAASEKLSWARRVAKPADAPVPSDGSSDVQ